MYDDVIKCKHFPCYWPFVLGIHRSPVNSPHKGQWRRALMFSLICAWINGWVNNREDGELRRHHAQYDVIVMEELGQYGITRPSSRLTFQDLVCVTGIRECYAEFCYHPGQQEYEAVDAESAPSGKQRNQHARHQRWDSPINPAMKYTMTVVWLDNTELANFKWATLNVEIPSAA